jgi:hypothetical protein
LPGKSDSLRRPPPLVWGFEGAPPLATGRGESGMTPKKKRPTDGSRNDELQALILDQRRDAGSASIEPDDGALGEPLFTRDGAIRSQGLALRELIAPAPDELLTRPPEEDGPDDIAPRRAARMAKARTPAGAPATRTAGSGARRPSRRSPGA